MKVCKISFIGNHVVIGISTEASEVARTLEEQAFDTDYDLGGSEEFKYERLDQLIESQKDSQEDMTAVLFENDHNKGFIVYSKDCLMNLMSTHRYWALTYGQSSRGEALRDLYYLHLSLYDLTEADLAPYLISPEDHQRLFAETSCKLLQRLYG